MTWAEMKAWLREQWRTIWTEDGRFNSRAEWWAVEKAYLKALGLFMGGVFLAFTLCLWVVWTVTYHEHVLVWVVNMVAFGVLCWVASEVFNDRSDNKHIRKEHWCPKCGQDVIP